MAQRTPLVRPVVYDATHLVSRLSKSAFSGIDRVDLGYAHHFTANPEPACGLHYGLRRPHILSPARLAQLAGQVSALRGEADAQTDSVVFTALRAWLTDAESGMPRREPSRRQTVYPVSARLSQMGFRLARDEKSAPDRAIYLNIAQSGLEFPHFFRWLSHRPDVLPVFMAHDLIPLDHPEFFRPGYEALFSRRLQTLMRHAGAVIVASAAVRDRLAREYRQAGQKIPPIHVQPLASPLGGPRSAADQDEALAKIPYFVMAATIEPRKNHLMLLRIWRELTAGRPDRPKLVLVGGRGWENRSVLAFLDRAKGIRNSIRHVSGLPRADLRKLIVNAQALLLPSFAEGYGLPVVEALSLGTPAIVSDLPVFQDVSQGTCLCLDPLDGLSWRRTIEAFLASQSPVPERARAHLKTFRTPDAGDYYAGIRAFLREF